MTLLLLTLLAAEPAAPAEPAPAPPAEKAEGAPAPAPAPAPVAQPPAADVPIPPIPAADVPDDIKNGSEESMGFLLFRTLIVLGLVVMLAYVSLNWGLRKLLGIRPPTVGGSLVSVIERVPLNQRHSLFVVKAANEYLLVGGTDASLGLITKLDTAEVDKLRSEKPPTAPLQLSPFLQKLLSRKGTK